MSASVISTESITGVAGVINNLKELTHSDLLKVMKSLISELSKKSKDMEKEVNVAKKGQKKAEKAKVPKEKKSLPKHLKKPHAWVAYTLQNALENGWPEFVIHQRRKNKETGEVEEEEIVMPAGVLNSDGAWVYDGSVGSEKNPSGKQLNHKEAMSLSKALKESNHTSWSRFEAQYVEDDGESDAKSDTGSELSKKSNVVRKTAAEKEAEKEAEKAAKEAEKIAAKAAKDAAKAAKDAEKTPAKMVKSTKVAVSESAPAPEEKKVVTKKTVTKK